MEYTVRESKSFFGDILDICFNCVLCWCIIPVSVHHPWYPISFHLRLGMLKIVVTTGAMGSAQHILRAMVSNEPQSIIWGQNTQSGDGVGALIWAFMGNLGSVETDVNACREPSTPVDTVLLLVKTQLGREGQKGVARGLFKRHLQTLM